MAKRRWKEEGRFYVTSFILFKTCNIIDVFDLFLKIEILKKQGEHSKSFKHLSYFQTLELLRSFRRCTEFHLI